MSKHKSQISLVIIEIEEPINDLLQRIALLHTAFIRVLVGTKLIEVLEANYEIGKIVAKIESRNTQPAISGKVCVHYELCYEDGSDS